MTAMTPEQGAAILLRGEALDGWETIGIYPRANPRYRTLGSIWVQRKDPLNWHVFDYHTVPERTVDLLVPAAEWILEQESET